MSPVQQVQLRCGGACNSSRKICVFRSQRSGQQTSLPQRRGTRGVVLVISSSAAQAGSSGSGGGSSSSSSSSSSSGDGASGGGLNGIWQKTANSLQNFGFGRRSIWEGGVGWFMIGGAVIISMLITWVKAQGFGSRNNPYSATFRFPEACGITVGSSVRIRGIEAGQVSRVTPALDGVRVNVEIPDSAILIPRNSVIEANQTGLISEALIDIYPKNPLPEPLYGPLDTDCKAEGLLVCHGDEMDGEVGISFDAMIRVCTKLAKTIDRENVERIFETADQFKQLASDAGPLIDSVDKILREVSPILKDLAEGDLVNTLESLTEAATLAAQDLHRLNSEVLTPDNVERIRESVATLTDTLKHIERVSGHVSSMTGDHTTQHNLRQLIEALSRMLSE